MYFALDFWENKVDIFSRYFGHFFVTSGEYLLVREIEELCTWSMQLQSTDEASVLLCGINHGGCGAPLAARVATRSISPRQ